jgi:hypothetical protein
VTRKRRGNPHLATARRKWREHTARWDTELWRVLAPMVGRGMTQEQIAEELNRRKVPTRMGKGKWSQTQVKRVLGRLKAATRTG